MPLHLARAPVPPTEWLAARPFTLALSAGYFGFFTHTGFLCALEDAGLRPCRVVGTSAGAITGGLWAAGIGGRALSRLNAQVRRDDFWDEGARPGWLTGHKLEAFLAGRLAEVGVRELQDCPTAFAAVAFDVWRLRSQVLDRGPMATALRASAALPGLFRPVRLGRRLLCDGGVRDRGAHCALEAGELTLLHHIPSGAWHHRISGANVLPDTPLRRTLIARPSLRIDPHSLANGAQVEQAAYEASRAWLAGA